jgi:tetratricopeptide (TPR) repeat protein
MLRALCVVVGTVLLDLALSAYGQGTQQSAPVVVVPCPALSPILDPSKKTWKHGDPERKAFLSAFSEKDLKQRTTLIGQFASQYPDSDYLDSLLLIKMSAEIDLKDAVAQLITAQRLVASTAADPRAKLVAYAAVADLQPAFIEQRVGSQVAPQLDDLAHTVTCGEQVLTVVSANVGVDQVRVSAAAAFAKARGYLAWRRGQYDTAKEELREAIRLKSDGYAAYLLLGAAQLSGSSPDVPAAVFSLARASILAPDVTILDKLLRDTYRSYHGSEKGLDKVVQAARINVAPPAGFKLEPQHAKSHVAAQVIEALAGLAVVGLAGYIALKDPGMFASQHGLRKVMIFGGLDHRTYLGCLNCPSTDSDSVLNTLGLHGSTLSEESIWNNLSKFGSSFSEYSSCNEFAKDPPVIVDASGGYLGRLTLNEYHPQIARGAELYDWVRTVVCSQ